MKQANSNLSQDQQGFTLIELMVVVVVVGILATLAGVTYGRYLKKARTVEAQSMLGAIADKQLAYYVEYSKYTDNLNALAVGMVGNLKYYTINITLPAGPTPQSFLATATGNPDSDTEIDEWTIDQNKNLLHTKID